jgi:hypothetical protein
MTSWLIDDFLADNEFFGAASAGNAPTILSSASSKTAYGTAFCLAKRQGVTVIGLTSAANLDFCRSLGCYHRVLTYDQIDQLDPGRAAVYVDFAGNATLRRDIHTRLPQLRYSCAVGGTHVDQLGGAHDLPGPRPTLFFAPAQIKKRSAEWGARCSDSACSNAWQDFLGTACDARESLAADQPTSGPAIGSRGLPARAVRSRRTAAGTHPVAARGLKKKPAPGWLFNLVEVSGIEPLASTLRTSRSPN